MSKSIILEESESHFDPEVIAAFLRAEDQFVEIRQHFLNAEQPAAVAV